MRDETPTKPGHHNRPRSSPVPVLIIEDDAAQATLVSRWLEGTGRFTVSVAEDGQRGSDLLAAKRWALIVSDIRLPFLDGLGLLRRFRMENRQTPFLLMSGCARFDDVQRAVRLQASDLLVKPLERTTFISRAMALAVSRVSEGTDDGLQGVPTAVFATLVESVAHDIANQVTLPLGYVDVLTLELTRPAPSLDKCREIVKVIADNTEALEESVSRLRDLARRPSGGEALINLGHLVQDVCEMVHFQVERMNATLDVDVAENVLIQADPVRYRFFIAALVLAAADLGGDNAGISIRVHEWGARARVDVDARCGASVRLRDLAATMRYLPQAHRWVPGAPVPSVVLGIGSTVSVDIRPDALTFCVMTRRVDDSASADRGRTRAPGTEVSTCRVLVVEDDVATATIAAEMLRAGLNCDVDVAHRLSDAWRLLDEWRYDMVITDLHIGQDSGLDLLAGLRSFAPSLADATILMSGDPALREVAGTTRFLSKPFTSEELVSAAHLVIANNGAPQ